MSEYMDTTAQIRRLQRNYEPPILTEAFSGDTRLIGRWRNEPFEQTVPPLDHHIISAVYAGDGVASVKVGASILSGRVRAGGITLCPSERDGHWRATGSIEVSNIFLGRDRLRACADQIGNGREPELHTRVHFGGDHKLFALMSLISDEISSADAMSHFYIEQLIDLVCLQLLRAHSSEPDAIAVAPRGGLSTWQVKRVTTYIRDNFNDTVRIQDLANLVNLSRFHFSTAFRVATGQTPYEWLTRERIDRAKIYLKDRSLRISDIAVIVGYETQSAFTARFRKLTGITPSEYRRRL